MEKYYVCIDLKSFYASVECVELGLDPFKTNLIVADPDRQEATVCLAITPAMKELGVKNRCRVFEIPKEIEYIMAKPRMKLYMQKSAEIYSIYLKYISPEDIHVYSVDECFIDVTEYMKLYGKTAREMAKTLIDAVYKQTGITATVGIGTNLFLAKVALDITAKHSDDFMGYLDEQKFKEEIWHHKPITDVWNIGRGTAKRLASYGIYDLHGITTCPEDLLYKEFGVNAELLIDHANGIEPCTIYDIQHYKTKSTSFSNGQVLFREYSYDEAIVILKEMVEQTCLELIRKELITDCISLHVEYAFNKVKATGGSRSLNGYTSSRRKITQAFINFYKETTRKDVGIKKIHVGVNNLIRETFESFDLFSDVEGENKDKSVQKTVISIKDKFGKNAILRGTSLESCATQRERNKMVGGHNAGEDES